MSADFTAETFEPHVGERFRIAAEEGEMIELELEEVTAGHDEATRSASAAGLRPPFSIVVKGPFDPLLPQKTYSLEHEELGSFDLFIVPIGRDPSGTQYEAVFA
jgi:hypothetical protein